uniref:NAC domain-containing protein 8-like n=1 Tax=Rhizophora mucronata TaxID=61149 RepID=A0A2P2R3L5_RHIMU
MNLNSSHSTKMCSFRKPVGLLLWLCPNCRCQNDNCASHSGFSQLRCHSMQRRCPVIQNQAGSI